MKNFEVKKKSTASNAINNPKVQSTVGKKERVLLEEIALENGEKFLGE